MKTIIKVLLGLLMAFSLASCEHYLDVKPNQSLATPTSLQDLKALLNVEILINGTYPDAGDVASDYYYLEDADWAARGDDAREAYLWFPDAQINSWYNNYSRINYANIVLDAIDNVKLGHFTEEDRRHVLGMAHFFRGFSFLHMVNLYGPPYEKGNNQGKLGIPLRLNADVNIVSTRASLEDSYSQILYELKTAAYHLPTSTTVYTHPSKATAHAVLARIYLIMGDFAQAKLYADSSLSLRNELMDYNTLDIKAAIPFNRFNVESLLLADMDGSSGMFNAARAKVNPSIYEMYDNNDLRKQLFFIENKDGSHSFKGSYSGKTATTPFVGIATDEVYLIRAECEARLGNRLQAIEDLNTLLVKRYVKGQFEPVQIANDDELIHYILKERKKQLVFRGGITWSDLRRLNLENRFAVDLVRRIDGKEYHLPANDLRYTFLIPDIVMQYTKMEQNLR